MQDSYTIKIQQFEGPFDLLLFFIERDELDIYDIPIATITDDFLSYIKQLEELNIDVASEFILVAATLMRIKARVLIPRKPLDEEGNEIDPREELVQRLLEYKRYKSVLDQIRAMEDERSKMHKRGNIQTELKSIANQALVDIELESLSLFKLLKTFEKVLENYKNQKDRTEHTIVRYKYQVADQQKYLLKNIPKGKKVSFKHLFEKLENRVHAIVTFLALLELLNTQALKLTQGEGINNFWLTV